MSRVRCINCGSLFTPLAQVPNQTFCSKSECQKARRRKWQKEKLRSDFDYRENQARAQKKWTDKNPDYWRDHRQSNSGSKGSVESIGDADDAKKSEFKKVREGPMLAATSASSINDGVYSLKVLAVPMSVKMDVWIVKLTSVDAASTELGRRIKR